MPGEITAGALAAGAGVGAAGGLVNTGVSGLINLGLQRDAQRFNREEAEKQRLFSHDESLLNREFQERMSSTAHQREMADLKAAGLNPNVLGAGQGASSANGSTNGGYAASSSASHVGSGSNGLGLLESMYNNAARETLQQNMFDFKREIRQEITSNASQAEKDAIRLANSIDRDFNKFKADSDIELDKKINAYMQKTGISDRELAMQSYLDNM